MKKIKIAAAQVTPIYLNKKKTVEKACKLISEAAKKGAKLVVFPEAFISGYPDWVWLISNSNGKVLTPLYVELVNNSISVPDDSTNKLCKAAAKAKIFVTIGINEINSEGSGNSLYNSILYISDRGKILGVHRKLIPTGGERLIWAQGSGDSLVSFDTSIGKIGGLICWENLMPLPRQTMYNSGVQIYVAPTWDKSDKWISSMQHIAREGGMFVISCCQAIKMKDIPQKYSFKKLYPEGREWINTGNSCIINPDGDIIAGPFSQKQGLIYADIDLDEIISAKRMFDSAGHYSRQDVFDFKIK
ncbi:MAG: nitrilase [Ignavibacteriales bacterium CG12_big_fil_rev_8_21_14_0_65_30_8]|nr:MAG: nitrilase [Ignavibacteriales bacterium CG12_big_fil_rev_8_21_14_0_65_30_8]